MSRSPTEVAVEPEIAPADAETAAATDVAETENSEKTGWLRSLLAAFLPGALAGTQVAGLLFFLNPHLPFDPMPVVTGVVFYGLLLGIAAMVLTLPFTRGRLEASRRWLPIGLTVVLASAGLSAWIHASLFAYYLPPGINRRLLKAAIWLSLAALICFYTALIHRVRHRQYGRRSLIVFVLMAVASVYVVMERREAFRPIVRPAPRPTTAQGSQRPRVYVVGIESATLDAILPLEEQGRLPFFSKILREGSHARLSTLLPSRRSALWTTLATGKYPYRHGVVGPRIFDAPFLSGEASLHLLPVGMGFARWGTWNPGRPADATTLRMRPMWDILSRLSVPTALVGWPLTAPPAADSRVMLSDRFFETEGEARFVEPADLAERARLFRPREGEIDPAIASRFGAEPPDRVLEALTQDLWRRDLSLFLLEQDPGIEAFFVVLPGLAEVSRDYFGGYAAIQLEGVPDSESERAGQLLAAYYTYLDDLLAQVWESGDDPRLLVVVSVHGAEGPRGWREARRLLLRKPAVEGYLDLGSDGVLMFLGAGIQPGAMARPAEIVDLVPTLLYGLGFPIARDLDGAVLTETFETGFLARQPLTFLSSYEALTERADSYAAGPE
ncbi:MAG: alkaline phosphatase family protein [bacterium]|nr:alkaline phosphatase family protein [bacterium]